MIEIEKKYFLSEITIKVNNRILTYDKDLKRAIYTYKGINQKEIKSDYARWLKVVAKYNLHQDYVFNKYEELDKCLVKE